MPYRRLPNTDQARVRALKAAVVKGDIYNVHELAISLKIFCRNLKPLKIIICNVMRISLGLVVNIWEM